MPGRSPSSRRPDPSASGTPSRRPSGHLPGWRERLWARGWVYGAVGIILGALLTWPFHRVLVGSPSSRGGGSQEQAPEARASATPDSQAPVWAPLIARHEGLEPSTGCREDVVNYCHDGDTFRIESESGKVRYLCVDAPEMDRHEPFAVEALFLNEQLVRGRRVTLEPDPAKGENAAWNRMQFYIWIKDVEGRWILVNEVLVRNGLAYLSGIQGAKHEKLLRSALDDARRERRGLWSTLIDDHRSVLTGDDEWHFHLEGCTRLERRKGWEGADLQTAVLQGLSPCRDCWKP